MGGGGRTIEATGLSYQAIRSVANQQRGIPETGRSWVRSLAGSNQTDYMFGTLGGGSTAAHRANIKKKCP